MKFYPLQFFNFQVIQKLMQSGVTIIQELPMHMVAWVYFSYVHVRILENIFFVCGSFSLFINDIFLLCIFLIISHNVIHFPL